MAHMHVCMALNNFALKEMPQQDVRFFAETFSIKFELSANLTGRSVTFMKIEIFRERLKLSDISSLFKNRTN
jgi:hypothetical protein